MSSFPTQHGADHLETVSLYALQALPAREVPAVESQIAACPECRRELEMLRPVVGALPGDLLRPSTSLWERLARRVGAETCPDPVAPPSRLREPDWEVAAPGIFCKVLSTDTGGGRVTMLVRLAPGAEYPPHTHAGLEELHMLEGELMVDDRKLRAGDYLRSEPGSTDRRVWSEAGCMGVLITSGLDVLI